MIITRRGFQFVDMHGKIFDDFHFMLRPLVIEFFAQLLLEYCSFWLVIFMTHHNSSKFAHTLPSSKSYVSSWSAKCVGSWEIMKIDMKRGRQTWRFGYYHWLLDLSVSKFGKRSQFRTAFQNSWTITNFHQKFENFQKSNEAEM